MMERRLNRQRLISVSSYVSPQPDIPAGFESLNDDTLRLILKFVGNMSYVTYAGINKHCRDVYINTKGMKKKTFVFGYASLWVIKAKIFEREVYSLRLRKAVEKGVIFFNRKDVLAWLLQQRHVIVLSDICNLAAREGRIDVLNEVLSYIGGVDQSAAKNVLDVYWEYNVFGSVLHECAASGGKLNVMKWLETKGLSITHQKYNCIHSAARHGHLHVLQWLQEEKHLELNGELYLYAVVGGQVHVMKWLREQGCPWDEKTFMKAAKEGNLDILQWLHDKGCPWSEDSWYRVHEDDVKPEVIEWLRTNGYSNRIVVSESDSDDSWEDLL